MAPTIPKNTNLLNFTGDFSNFLNSNFEAI